MHDQHKKGFSNQYPAPGHTEATEIVKYFFTFPLSPLKPYRVSAGWCQWTSLPPHSSIPISTLSLPPRAQPYSIDSHWPKAPESSALTGQGRVAFTVFLRMQAQVFLILQRGAFTTKPFYCQMRQDHGAEPQGRGLVAVWGLAQLRRHSFQQQLRRSEWLQQRGQVGRGDERGVSEPACVGSS